MINTYKKEGEEAILGRGKSPNVQQHSKIIAHCIGSSEMSIAHQSVPCQTKIVRSLYPGSLNDCMWVAPRRVRSCVRQLFTLETDPKSSVSWRPSAHHTPCSWAACFSLKGNLCCTCQCVHRKSGQLTRAR